MPPKLPQHEELYLNGLHPLSSKASLSTLKPSSVTAAHMSKQREQPQISTAIVHFNWTLWDIL